MSVSVVKDERSVSVSAELLVSACIHERVCVCVCVCVRAHARACVCVTNLFI